MMIKTRIIESGKRLSHHRILNGLILLIVVIMTFSAPIKSDDKPFRCPYRSKTITMKFKSPLMGKTCEGEAACFSKQNTKLETNFIVPSDAWTEFNVNNYNVLAASGALDASVKSIFNPCLPDASKLNSVSTFSINGQPVFVGRKNLGKDFVTYKCVSKGSCTEAFIASSGDGEYPYSGFFNLTSSGNVAVLEYSDPLTDLCVYNLEFSFCYVPKSYKIYDLRLQADEIATKPLKIISPKMIESLKTDVLIPQSYDPLQNGYSDIFTRKITITNRSIMQLGKLFNLRISTNNAYDKDPLVVNIISVTKEKSVDGNFISQDISGEYQISNRSLSNYIIGFNTSLSVDEIITVQITLGVYGQVSSSVYDMNMNYYIEMIDEDDHNLKDTTIIDRVYYFKRTDYTATYDTKQKISAKSLISDMVSLDYVSETQEDGKCYLQLNTLYSTSTSDTFSGLFFIYSTKTGKQYSMKFGQDYALDKNKQVSQYMIPPELLDCSTVGAKTSIYMKWVVLSSQQFTESKEPSASFNIAISKKNVIFVNDLSNANLQVTFSQKYESNVILIKATPNMIVPYDIILKNSYASSSSPFASYLSYSVPLSWLDNSPMTLNPVSYPQLSTDFSASEIYLKTGMYFAFVELTCNLLPCKSSINFKINSQLASPPSIALGTPLQVSQSGYRSSGYITAVSIPSLARATSSSNFVLRVLAEVKKNYYDSYSSNNPYYLQASKGSVGMTQNPPYNSTYHQQMTNQNYLSSTDKCSSSYTTAYLTVNIPIRDQSDYGTWYIAFFSDPNVSFDVKYTITLMSNIIQLASSVSDQASKGLLGFTPISTDIYGLQFSSASTSDSSLSLSFDGYSLDTSSLVGSGMQIFLKHGSMPTENDYEVISPVLVGSDSFVVRFVYSEKVTFRYLMDNSYYSNPAERIKYPEDYYKTSILSNSKLDTSTLYVMLKRVPTGGTSNCISNPYIVSSSSYFSYKYSSSQQSTGGFVEKMKSQVISVNPDVISKNLAINGNQLMIDFNQETITPDYSAKPTVVSYNGKTLEILVDQNSTINSDSITVSSHTFSYYIFGKSTGQIPTVSFRYSINAKLSTDSATGKYSQQVFIVFPIKSGVITPNAQYDTIVRMNSIYQPSTYLVESLNPSIIATAVVVGISFFFTWIYFVWAVYIVVVKRGQFNFGTVSSKMWLGCLCPASLPVSVCYFYYFSHEGFSNKLAPPTVKRMRRSRFLIALSIISFIIGTLFGLYLYGHVAFNHLGLELSAKFNLYTLGKRTTDSTYSSSRLIPCCAQTRTGTTKDKQFRTYFGVESSTFTPTFSGGRLDCIKDYDSIVRDALRSKFILEQIDGQIFEPPNDDAIQKTNYGYSNAFQLATVYCVGNSVVLMKADDSYNEYGIPGAFLSIFPILYSFYLIALVLFEKVFGDGRKLKEENNNEQVGRTTLLIGSEPNTTESSNNIPSE